jgi:hypothetical protein
MAMTAWSAKVWGDLLVGNGQGSGRPTLIAPITLSRIGTAERCKKPAGEYGVPNRRTRRRRAHPESDSVASGIARLFALVRSGGVG